MGSASWTVVQIDHYQVIEPGHKPVGVVMTRPARVTIANQSIDALTRQFAQVWCKTIVDQRESMMPAPKSSAPATIPTNVMGVC